MKLVVELVGAFFWWNPLFHWLKKQVSDALEYRVDRHLIRQFSDMQNLLYLECLLKVAKYDLGENGTISPSLTCSHSAHLVKRFEYALDQKKKPRTVSIIFVFVFSVLAICSLFVVIEPHRDIPFEIESTTVSAPDPATSFLVQNDDGTYDLYIDNLVFGQVTNPSFFEGVPIYEKLEEVKE